MKKILFVAAAAVVLFSGCAKTGINNGDLEKSPCSCLNRNSSEFNSWIDINNFFSKYLYPRIILS
ncbi:MAG: hypothetical protein AB7D96_02330 [Arcobacteraceae bacterium]